MLKKIKSGCKRLKNKFYYIILPSVIGVATLGLIFQMIYFLPAIQTLSRKLILQTSCVGFYIMCFISYYQAINITNDIPQTIIPPRKKNQLRNNHTFYTQKKLCQKQNQRFKPARTSHCHLCRCVSRMDHHCPYTNNCVGSKNLKAFILFNFYGGLFAFQFFIMSFVYFFKLKYSETQNQLSQGELFSYILLFLSSFSLTFSMNGIWISNLYLVYLNVTQLQMMKGHFRMSDNYGTHPNPFDLGGLTNFNTTFMGDYWLFWLPTQVISDTDGSQFPMRPAVYQEDIKGLPQQIQQSLKSPLQKSIPSTIQQLREKQYDKYENYIFFYLGEQFRLKSKKEKEQEEIKKKLQEVNQEQHNVEEQQINEKTQQEMQMLEGIYDQQL